MTAIQLPGKGQAPSNVCGVVLFQHLANSHRVPESAFGGEQLQVAVVGIIVVVDFARQRLSERIESVAQRPDAIWVLPNVGLTEETRRILQYLVTDRLLSGRLRRAPSHFT